MCIGQGDYDYFRGLETLEVGEDNSKLEPNKERKIVIYHYGQAKSCYRY